MQLGTHSSFCPISVHELDLHWPDDTDLQTQRRPSRVLVLLQSDEDDVRLKNHQ